MRKALIKKEKYVEFFQRLAKSDEVTRLENKTLVFGATIHSYDGEELPELIKQIGDLEKEAEKGRALINDIVNDIKRENQKIYQTVKDKLKELKTTAKNKYTAFLQAEEQKRIELQRKLEREAEEKRRKLEEERKKAEEDNSPLPPEIVVPTPVVKEIPVVKTAAQKSIKVIVHDKIAFIKDAVKRNDMEMFDCIEITKTTGIVNKVKRNPAKETENGFDGAEIILLPTRGAWGIE